MGEGKRVDWILAGRPHVKESEKVSVEEIERIAKKASAKGVNLAVKGGADGKTTIITPYITVVEDLPGPQEK